LSSRRNYINGKRSCIVSTQANKDSLRQKSGLQSKLRHLQALEKLVRSIGDRFNDFQTQMIPVKSIMEDKAKHRRLVDLKELLGHSRKCEASDPRDRVYAFLGLADRRYDIKPTYTWGNMVAHLMIETAQKIFSFDGSLSILSSASGGTKNLGTLLPTWVPDLSLHLHLLTLNKSQLVNQYSASIHDTDCFTHSGRATITSNSLRAFKRQPRISLRSWALSTPSRHRRTRLPSLSICRTPTILRSYI
jgi:hypothetical protein